MLSPIQQRFSNIDHTVNGTFENVNDISTKTYQQSVSEMFFGKTCGEIKLKAKTAAHKFLPFSMNALEIAIYLGGDLRFVTEGHSSNLISFLADPQQFLPPFGNGL